MADGRKAEDASPAQRHSLGVPEENTPQEGQRSPLGLGVGPACSKAKQRHSVAQGRMVKIIRALHESWPRRSGEEVFRVSTIAMGPVGSGRDIFKSSRIGSGTVGSGDFQIIARRVSRVWSPVPDPARPIDSSENNAAQRR